MRLLQSGLSCLQHTKQPQHTFVTHLLGRMLMLPGHATFRNMRRYSPYHARTFARWYGRNFDWVSLNQAAITEVVPPEHEQTLVMDASFVPKSGQHTYGLRIPVIPATQSGAKRFWLDFGDTGQESPGHRLWTPSTGRLWTLASPLLPCLSLRMSGVMTRHAAQSLATPPLCAGPGEPSGLAPGPASCVETARSGGARDRGAPGQTSGV